MLVNTFGKKITSSTVVKNSQFYIETAKFVQAYSVIVSNPNEFLAEIGENQIDKNKEKLSWKNLVDIMQKCNLGFSQTPTESDLLIYFNYAVEMGSIKQNDKRIATVDDIADAQKNYYNFVDEATDKANSAYLKQRRISRLRDEEVVQIERTLSSFNMQKWIAFSLSIVAVVIFCLGFAGLFFKYPLVVLVGKLIPVFDSQYVGSALLMILAILMFFFCEKWQIKSLHDYQKLNYASKTIFARSDSNAINERILRIKLEALSRDLEIIQKEINDPNKSFDVKTNIEQLVQTNEYYKKYFASYQSSMSAEARARQMSFADQTKQVIFEEDEQKQEIILEGQFDDEAYKAKFEQSRVIEQSPEIQEEKLEIIAENPEVYREGQEFAGENIITENQEAIENQEDVYEDEAREEIIEQQDNQNEINKQAEIDAIENEKEKEEQAEKELYYDYINEILGSNFGADLFEKQ